VLIIRRSKLYYTAFGIITPTGARPVNGTGTCRCDCYKTICTLSWLITKTSTICFVYYPLNKVKKSIGCYTVKNSFGDHIFVLIKLQLCQWKGLWSFQIHLMTVKEDHKEV